MKFITIIEENFWIPFVIAMVFGLVAPMTKINLSQFVLGILMTLFFLTCLKVSFFDVLVHIKMPKFFSYVLLVYLFIVPAIFYMIFHFISPELSIAVLLLSAMPTAIVAPVFAEFFRGNISLSLALSLVSHLIVPFSIPLLFLLLTQQTITIDFLNLFKTLVLISFVPLGTAEIVKKIAKTMVNRTKRFYSFSSVILVSVMIYCVISSQAKTILQYPFEAIINILWLWLLFFLLYIVGYFVAFWRKKTDKISLAVSKAYMNMGPAIGLSVIFFGPKVALIVVLAEVPWNTTLGPFRYLLKYLK